MMTSLRHKWLRFSLTAVLLSAFPLASLFAQGAGARLEGIVKDASQAVIPGVTVTATNEGTNISTTSVTNETGFYVFVSLPPGTYTLTSELQGFKRYVNKGIVLQVGATLAINIVLETGEVNTEVVVSAAAPLIDVTSGKVGNVVQERQVVDLPLNGRNPMMLFYLQAGTNPRDSLGGQQAVGSVDGLRTNANNVRVEGVWASDASYDMSPAAPNASVPLEAVGEYRVTTSSASADSGRGAGAQVSVVYKSGTNSFHGSVYEFNRNTAYNAGDFFANKQNQDKPKFLRNQYGASLGGPIIKNKTFFFATWEGQKEIQGSVLNRYAYTSTLRDTGVYRYLKGGRNSGSIVDGSGNPTVPDSSIGSINLLTIDPSRQGLDPMVAAMFKKLPLPNNYEIGDGLNYGGFRMISNEPNDYNQAVVKVDHTLSTKNQLSISMGGYWRTNSNTFLLSGYPAQIYDEQKRNIMIGLVSGLKSTLTNELHLGATRRYTMATPGDPANFAHTGVYNLYGIISSGNRGSDPEGNLVAVYLPQRNPINAFNVADSLAWVMKNHTFKFGFEVAHTTKYNWFGGDEYIPAIYTNVAYNSPTIPSSAVPQINSNDLNRARQFLNDLTGTIGNINQTYNANSIQNGFVPYDTRSRYLIQREWGAFFQDTWKVAQNLTFNYGVRWDLLPPGWMKDGIYTYPVGGSKAVLGISGPLGEFKTGLAPNRGKDIINWDWNNFGPNVGLTWDPFKDGKMSVSANYRIAYDRSMQSVYNRLEDQNIGMNVTSTVYPSNLRFSTIQTSPYWQQYQGAPGVIVPVGQPLGPIPFTRQNRAYALDENIVTPYTENWSLRIQREIGKDWYVQGAYVGNISVGGWRAMNYNQVEIRSNGFLSEFMTAQRNLATNGSPNKGEPLGNLGKLFAPLKGIPSSLNSYISQGQAAYLANYIDTTNAITGTYGGAVKAAGLPETYFRMNPQVANANIADNMSVSTWNGLKVDVGKRFSQGTYVQVNYTLGKGLTDYTGGQTLYQDFRDNQNRKLDKTLQQYDSTHIIQGNVIWELPVGVNKKWLSGMSRWQDAFLGGWQLNAIVQMATARPLTITTNNYYTISQGRAATANYAGTDFNITAKAIRGASSIYSLTPDEIKLFGFPGAGNPGGTPYYAFRGPRYFNIDTSMIKNFKLAFLGEAGSLQVRAEAFNVLNHVNFNLPSGNITSGSFGVISGGTSPRVLQFALKVNF